MEVTSLQLNNNNLSEPCFHCMFVGWELDFTHWWLSYLLWQAGFGRNKPSPKKINLKGHFRLSVSCF